jgi:hypothetical protein
MSSIATDDPPEPNRRPRQFSTVLFRGKYATVVSPTGYYQSGHVDILVSEDGRRRKVQAVPPGPNGWSFPGSSRGDR